MMAPDPRSPTPATDTRIFWWLLAAGLALRAALIAWFAAVDDGFLTALREGEAHSELYRAAIGPHLWSYLLYEHTLPPLFTLRDALVQALFPADAIVIAKYGLVALLGAVGGGLSFLLARLLGLGRPLSVLVAAIVTGRWVLWEVWRFGQGWDSLNPFLVLLFAVTLLHLLAKPTAARGWAAGAAGALLTASFSFGAPIVAPAVAAALGVLLLRRQRPRGAAGLVLLPVAVIAAMVAKNGVEHGLWAMSSGVGQNVMQAYNSVLKDPTGRGRGVYLLAKRAGGYPDWWFWCYDEAERRPNHPTPNIAGFYGLCVHRITPRGWTYDYADIDAYLAANPAPALAAVVAKDRAIARDRPWLWSGPVAARATGLSIEYGKVATRLVGDTLVHRPFYFIRRAHRTLLSHWLRHGAEFLVFSNRARFPEPLPLYVFNWLGYPLFYGGFGLSLFFFFRSGWRLLRRPLAPDLDRLVAGTGLAPLMLSVLVVPAMFASFLLACCENYRHAFVFFPLLVVLTVEVLRRPGFWEGLDRAARRAAARLRRPLGQAR